MGYQARECKKWNMPSEKIWVFDYFRQKFAVGKVSSSQNSAPVNCDIASVAKQ